MDKIQEMAELNATYNDVLDILRYTKRKCALVQYSYNSACTLIKDIESGELYTKNPPTDDLIKLVSDYTNVDKICLYGVDIRTIAVMWRGISLAKLHRLRQLLREQRDLRKRVKARIELLKAVM